MTTAPTAPAAILCQRFAVVGMSCSHCEHAISDEVTNIDGVVRATADATTGILTIEATHEIDPAAVAVAVDEAGYEVAR
ncbi:MAG TPA: heavy metal-associated domain-containing protein [Acidimicrobiales bacterium]|nr:heavy metal-associated domain-containing protein [Acidimicrobiales bacterium]